MLFNKLASSVVLSLAAVAFGASSSATKSSTSAASKSSSSSDELPTIDIIGNKFFFANGSQFYIRGIAYQQDTANTTEGESFNDPLADASACERDIPYLKAVDTNTIRVYALNSTLDHSDCMNQLADAGIYVIADLSEPDLSIDRSSPSWTVELYDRYKAVIDEFQAYTNVLGFFAGNEVTNDDTNTAASAFVKAAIRDSKAYIKEQGYRNIPVGYSSNDDSEIRVPLADYFACGDEDIRADFFGINMYEWCGSSSFADSGYETATKNFANLSIPIFFSEYGCNKVQPRKFTEVQALYGSDMTDVWSGGIVYMYFEEANNYGLVTISGDSVSTLADYNYYKSEILSISPSSAAASAASASAATTDLSCPTQNQYWAAATKLPPTPDESLCECMEKSLGCVVADDVDSDDYADLFSIVCDYVSCDGISANGTTGEYGAYSFCDSKQQLSFVMNLYYESQGKDSSACDFSGSASVNSKATTASACTSALSAAGSDGVSVVSGTVSGSGTTSGTATSSDSSSTSGKSSSASSSKHKSSGAAVQAPMMVELVLGSLASIFVIGGVSLVLI